MAPKRLEPDVTASAPNQKWVSDLTDWGTGEGWLDLAVVLDWESRAGVGGFRGERMSRDRVIQALTMALWRRRPKAGLIAHSDRGRQYAANDYPRWLNSPGLLCSRSRQGDCDDNAAMERVFHSLKIEPTEGKRDATRKEAKAECYLLTIILTGHAVYFCSGADFLQKLCTLLSTVRFTSKPAPTQERAT